MATSVNHGNLSRVMLGVAAVLIALAGCGTTPQGRGAETGPEISENADAGVEAEPRDTRKPVADAGGMCKLLTYQAVADATGVQFDHAASARGGCALQVLGHNHPDLILAASGTEVEAKTFQEAFAPDGASEIDGLGSAAYRSVGRPEGKAGPTAEVGWLAGKKFYLLRYTFEKGTTNGQAREMARKLVALATNLNTG